KTGKTMTSSLPHDGHRALTFTGGGGRSSARSDRIVEFGIGRLASGGEARGAVSEPRVRSPPSRVNETQRKGQTFFPDFGVRSGSGPSGDLGPPTRASAWERRPDFLLPC